MELKRKLTINEIILLLTLYILDHIFLLILKTKSMSLLAIKDTELEESKQREEQERKRADEAI